MTREFQKDWKRTQLRLPSSHYEAVLAYADNNNLSINSAILELIDKALFNNPPDAGILNDDFADTVARKVFDLINK